MMLLIVKNKYPILLVILSLIIIFSQLLYTLKTNQYPHEDEHVYLETAVQFYDSLKNPSFGNLTQMANSVTYRQPFYPLFLAIPLLIFGTENAYKTSIFMNSLFYITSIVSIYFITKELIDRKTGLIASTIFAFYGFPLFYLHFAYSENATSALCILSILFLLKSKLLTIKKYSFLFSICFSITTLTRWVAPFFILGPFLVTLTTSLFKKSKSKRKYQILGLNITIILITCVVPTLLLYYIPKFSYFSSYVSGQMSNSPIWVSELKNLSPELKDTFSIRSLMFYFNVISQQTIYLLILFAAGNVICLRYYKKFSILLAGFWIPYFIFTFFSVLKMDRYIVPIYPFMAIISASTFNYISNNKIKNSLLIITILVSTLNFVGGFWGIGPLGKEGLKSIVLPEFIHHPRRIYLTTIIWPPVKDYSNAPLLFTVIQNDFKGQKPATVLDTFTNQPLENALHTIATYEKRGVIKIDTLRNIKPGNYEEIILKINQADYILLKDGKPIDNYRYTSNADKEVYMMKIFNDLFMKSKTLFPFEEINKIHLPIDNTNIVIMKKINKLNGDQSNSILKELKNID